MSAVRIELRSFVIGGITKTIDPPIIVQLIDECPTMDNCLMRVVQPILPGEDIRVLLPCPYWQNRIRVIITIDGNPLGQDQEMPSDGKIIIPSTIISPLLEPSGHYEYHLAHVSIYALPG